MGTLKGKGKGHGKDKHADGRDKGYGKTAANKSDIVTLTAASKAAAGWRQRFRSRSRSRVDVRPPNWRQQVLNPIRPPGRREVMTRPKPLPKALPMPKALEAESVDSSDASDESDAGDASGSSSAWQCEHCGFITGEVVSTRAELGDRCVLCGKGHSQNDQARVVMSTDE